VEPDVVVHNNELVKSLMAKFSALLQPGKPWLFGSGAPSALDAHLAVFLARMRDIGRSDLISSHLAAYLERVERTVGWQRVMKGRRTMPGL